ncbi:MAG: RpiB/LacA/LacB family sugar-phosphate isomerase [Bacilli bacterium]
MKIGLASDHGGYKLKEKLKNYLKKIKIETIDYGTNSTESVDYPDFAHKLCEGINNKDIDYGIAICSTGIGISIACNKVKGIRCAKVDNVEEAKMTRLDNDANCLALNGRMPTYLAKDIIDTFINTDFSNLERHKRRIKKLEDNME